MDQEVDVVGHVAVRSNFHVVARRGTQKQRSYETDDGRVPEGRVPIGRAECQEISVAAAVIEGSQSSRTREHDRSVQQELRRRV
jgi:hypothetical protein